MHGAVISTAACMFPDHDKWNIMAILDQYNYRYSTEARRACVQLAILKLSEGNIEKLRELVDIANVDFRDVLY